MKSSTTDSTRLTAAEFIARCRDLLIPLPGSVSYFSVPPVDEKDSERLVLDPASAFPPKLLELIPNLCLILVPYLEADPSSPAGDPKFLIAFKEPSEEARKFVAFQTVKDDGAKTYLFLAVRDEGLFDAHIVLYKALAEKIVDSTGSEFMQPFSEIVDRELGSGVRGELYEPIWELKKELLGYKGDGPKRAELLAEYLRESLVETLTLYLHGLCCDVDVIGGPKQLPSKLIRDRLEMLRKLLPPPDGVALFPDELAVA